MEKAIAFLSDPHIVNSDDTEKRQFLRHKGFSDADIDQAMSRINNPAPPLPPFHPTANGLQQKTTQWLFVLLLAGGTVFYHYRRILTVPRTTCNVQLIFSACIVCRSIMRWPR